MPQVVFLLLRQFIIRSKDGEIVFRGFTDEFFQPFAHLFATPTNHSSVIYTQSAIGDDKMFVYSDYLAEAFAIGAGTNGGVERKHLVVGFLKGNTVCFKLRAEGKKLCAAVR